MADRAQKVMSDSETTHYALNKKLRRHLLWSCVLAAFVCGISGWEAWYVGWKPVLIGFCAGGLVVVADWARSDYARFRRQMKKSTP